MTFYRQMADVGSIVLACTSGLLGIIGLLLFVRPVGARRTRGADFLCDVGCGTALSCGWGLSAVLIEGVNVGILGVTTGGEPVTYPLLTAPFVFALSLLLGIPYLLKRPYHHVRRAFLKPPDPPDSRRIYRPRVKRSDVNGLLVVWAITALGTAIGPLRSVIGASFLVIPAMSMYLPFLAYLGWELGLNFTRYQRWYGAALLVVAALGVAGSFGLRALPV